MRRFISALISLCLLHVTTHGALAELAEISHPTHSTVTIKSDTTPNTQQASLQDTLHDLRSKVSESLNSAASYVTSHPIIWAPLATVATVVLYICFVSMIMDLNLGTFPGSSIAPNFQGIYHRLTLSSGHYNVLDYTPDYSNLSPLQKTLVQRDAWKSETSAPLPQAAQAWFNSANNILALASTIALQYRHNEQPSPQDLQKFSTAAAAVFETHSARLFNDIACDLTIGSEQGQDQLSNCHTEKRPADWAAVTVTSDAQVWFLGSFGQFSSAHLLPKTTASPHYYSHQDTSPDYGNVNNQGRTSARRHLIKALDTPIPLPEAIKNWFSNALHWTNQAADIASTLQAHQCPHSAEIEALHTLTSRVFDGQQALLTETIRCDFDLQRSTLHITTCAVDQEPTDYNHDTLCDMHSHVKFQRDGAIWLIPNAANHYSTFLMAAHQPAPTPSLSHTPSPTLEPVTLKPATQEPTSAPTPEQTLQPTSAPTPAPTQVPTTTAPTKNTTTRLYWANQADSTLWTAEINSRDRTAFNARVFIGSGINKPQALFVSEALRKIFWSENNSGKGVFFGDIVLSDRTFIANKTLLFNMYVSSIFFDHESQKLFWLTATLKPQLYSASIDFNSASKMVNLKSILTLPQSAWGIYLDLQSAYIYWTVIGGLQENRGVFKSKILSADFSLSKPLRILSEQSVYGISLFSNILYYIMAAPSSIRRGELPILEGNITEINTVQNLNISSQGGICLTSEE